jgi:hypothetical protein
MQVLFLPRLGQVSGGSGDFARLVIAPAEAEVFGRGDQSYGVVHQNYTWRALTRLNTGASPKH